MDDRTIYLRQAMSGDVNLSLERPSTGQWWDNTKSAFVDVPAGSIPPRWPVPEGPFPGLRRHAFPVPPDRFPDGWLCFVWTSGGVAIMAEIWCLDYEAAKGPFPASLDGAYWVSDGSKWNYQLFRKV